MAIEWDESHGQAYEREPSPRGRPDWPVWLMIGGVVVAGLLLTSGYNTASHSVVTLCLSAVCVWLLNERDDLRRALAQERQASHAFEQTATALMQRARR